MKLNIMTWNLSQTSESLTALDALVQHWLNWKPVVASSSISVCCWPLNKNTTCYLFRASRSTSAALRGQLRCSSALMTLSLWRPQIALWPMTATLTRPPMGTTLYPPCLIRRLSRCLPKVSLAMKDPTVHLKQVMHRKRCFVATE